jgi:ferritin-like metal-binding protein YciE
VCTSESNRGTVVSGAVTIMSNWRNAVETFQDLFEKTLRDMYYAEKAILKALPKMAKKASSGQLAAAFTSHQEQTEQQVVRLERIFGRLGKIARGEKCAAIDGILEEGLDVIKQAKDDTRRCHTRRRPGG